MRLPSRVLSVALVSAVLTLPTASVADRAERTAAQQVEQRGTTSLTAPVVQPGRGDAPSDRALVQGSVSFKPAEKGRRVVVERRTATSDWQKVTTVRQDRAGVARFTGAPTSSTGEAYVYRGVALRAPGLPKFAATEESTTRWQPQFTDEFSGSVLDPRWADRASEAASRKCSTVGDPRARAIGGGTLKLRAMLDPQRKDDRCRVSGKKLRYYLNGQVSTDHLDAAGDFTYGTFAARLKFPANRGQHGAFWMQPTKGASDEGTAAASGAEIDVVEFFGKGYQKGGLASFLYNYGVLDRSGDPVKIGGMAPSATRMLPRGDAWWKRFHVFSVEWTPNSYTFMVDGRAHFRTKRGVSGVDEYLILSMLTSDWELLQAKKLGISPGGSMQVDWTRVWQRP
jgi:beta-glucanase (GH16 family)